MYSRTLILQNPLKLLNPTHASLFDLLPLFILAYVDIRLSGLEHCDKFKHIILRFKSMSNPVLFAVSHDYWTPTVQYCWVQLVTQKYYG